MSKQPKGPWVKAWAVMRDCDYCSHGELIDVFLTRKSAEDEAAKWTSPNQPLVEICEWVIEC